MFSSMETPFYHEESTTSFQIHKYDRFQSQKIIKTSSGTTPHDYPVANPKPMQPSSSTISMSAGFSAELNVLKLSSPDLEYLMVPSGSQITNEYPSSGGFGYRGQATHEQEGFADGFVKALADLHKQNQLTSAPIPPTTFEMPVYSALSGYAHPHGYTSGQLCCVNANVSCSEQTVPEAPGSPPPRSPVDMGTQERVKAERKKLRNRIAASKCRKRKLERILRLEERVQALKSQNADLASTAGALRAQVAVLKHKVMSHITQGCQLQTASASSCARMGKSTESSHGSC